jgi:4-amino-4-deoxy-L-arabinose transferase-like glycosyltransferase
MSSQSKLRKYAPFLIFVIIALIIAKVTWQGYSNSFDDSNYLYYSYQMIDHLYIINQSPYAYGSGFVTTIAAGLWLSGGAAWGASIPQILEFIGIISILYICLLKYFDQDVAFITSLGCEISGFAALYITRVLPDPLLGFLIALVFLILAYKPKSKKYMLLAGFISGLVIFVKFGGYSLLVLLALGNFGIYIPIVLAIVIAVLFVIGKSKRALFAAGFIAALALYQFLLPKGLSLIKLASLYDKNQASISLATLNSNLNAALINLVGYFPPFYTQIYTLGLISILAVIGTFIIIRKRDKRLYFVITAFWLAVLYLYFGPETLSLNPYIFITVVSRYFIEFLVPMALLAGAAISHGASKVPKESRRAFLIIILLLILVSNITPYIIVLRS